MRKLVWIVVVAALLFSPAMLLIAAIEFAPAIGPPPPGTVPEATRARKLLREYRDIWKRAPRSQELSISQSDLKSVLAFVTRAWPFFRGQAVVDPDAVRIAFSAKIPRLPGDAWLNVRFAVRSSRNGLRLASVRFGRFQLPAWVTISAARFVLDRLLGDSLGTIAIGGIKQVVIDGDLVRLRLEFSEQDRQVLLERAKNRMRSFADIDRIDTIRVYYRTLDDVFRQRRVVPRGTFLPYLRRVINLAHKRAQDGDEQRELRAALVALAIYCGHSKFQTLTGPVVPEELRRRPSGCADATLAKRRDLRQHFVISAGLKAITSANVAFAAGEFKELVDAGGNGSGFSFDDLAADRAGIRFAATFLRTKRARWRRLIDQITSESAIFPNTSGLSAGLSELEFKRRYLNIESQAYKDMLAEIEARIDRLAFFTVP